MNRRRKANRNKIECNVLLDLELWLNSKLFLRHSQIDIDLYIARKHFLMIAPQLKQALHPHRILISIIHFIPKSDFLIRNRRKTSTTFSKREFLNWVTRNCFTIKKELSRVFLPPRILSFCLNLWTTSFLNELKAHIVKNLQQMFTNNRNSLSLDFH